MFDVVPARHVKRKYVVWRAWCPTCGEWPKRVTLRWGSGPRGLLSSASNPDALIPRAKPVPLPQAVGLISLRNEDVVAKLIDVLNELARDPERNVSDLLWGKTDKP